MKNIIILIMMLLGVTGYAQQAPGPNSASSVSAVARKAKAPKTEIAKPIEQNSEQNSLNGQFASPVSVQILAGSQGVGADLKYGYTRRLAFRAGFGLIPVNVNDAFSFSSFNTSDQLSAKFANVHLLADFAPFSSNKFRIVGGAAYIVKGNANAIISPTGSYQFGDATITKDQIGSLSAAVTWKGVAPYLGVSLFKGFPNRLFNLNLDLGTYYLSRPGTSLTGTKLLSDNSSQEPQFNQNMQGYRWLPVIQLNFNFRIK